MFDMSSARKIWFQNAKSQNSPKKMKEDSWNSQGTRNDDPWKYRSTRDDDEWKYQSKRNDDEWKYQSKRNDDPWKYQSTRNDDPWKYQSTRNDDPWKSQNTPYDSFWNSVKQRSTGPWNSQSTRNDRYPQSAGDPNPWSPFDSWKMHNKQPEGFSKWGTIGDTKSWGARNESSFSSQKDGAWNLKSWTDHDSWNSRGINQGSGNYSGSRDDGNWSYKDAKRGWFQDALNGKTSDGASAGYRNLREAGRGVSALEPYRPPPPSRFDDFGPRYDSSAQRYGGPGYGGPRNANPDNPYYRPWLKRALKREQAAQKTGQEPQETPKKCIVQKCWWTEECQKAHDDFKALKKKYAKQKHTEENQRVFKIAKYKYRAVLRAAKLKYMKETEGEEKMEDDESDDEDEVAAPEKEVAAPAKKVAAPAKKVAAPKKDPQDDPL